MDQDKNREYYVTRSEDGRLVLHDGRPQTFRWKSQFLYIYSGVNGIYLDGELFPDLKFGDEPIRVKVDLAAIDEGSP